MEQIEKKLILLYKILLKFMHKKNKLVINSSAFRYKRFCKFSFVFIFI